jgi:hypothetical protein
MDTDDGAARREPDSVSGRATADEHDRSAPVLQHRTERVGVELHPHAGAANHGLEPRPIVERSTQEITRGTVNAVTIPIMARIVTNSASVMPRRTP